MTIHIDWTKGLNAKARGEMEQQWDEALYVRQRLVTMIGKSMDVSSRYAENKERYKDPSWAPLQADEIGYHRAMREVVRYLTSSS